MAEAHARHRRGIECGTQYATETGEIAREGSAALPDLVAAIASDTSSDEAVFVFYMMGDQALEALPELLELSNSANGRVRDVALEALSAMLSARPLDECFGQHSLANDKDPER